MFCCATRSRETNQTLQPRQEATPKQAPARMTAGVQSSHIERHRHAFSAQCTGHSGIMKFLVGASLVLGLLAAGGGAAWSTTISIGASRVVSGGLALWQERRAKEMLAANVSGRVSVSELAAECGVSGAHFARAFRQSTGVPPHRWLTERRIDMAKHLLQHSSEPIAVVAVTCGFSDQSHLTHMFRKQVGHSPRSWRRLQTP